MASEICPPTIQITPLFIHNDSSIAHRVVSSASNLNPDNPACSSCQDSGDIISYIQKLGDAKKAVVERMDGTRIASFDLPVSAGDGFKDDAGPILCWASFQRGDCRQTQTDERKMLCVLSNPTTLHIFDVLGDFNLSKQEGGSIGPSGHTIPLPFRAHALFSVDYFGSDNCHGLMIVRAPSDKEPVPAEVPFSPEGLSIPGTPRRNRGSDADDDLQLPPEPVRLNFQRDELMDLEDEEVVPSLFSLCHPLDEIRPVAKSEVDRPGNNSGLFTNADERLMFVGTPRLFARHESHSVESAQTYATPICVTYNQSLKRHSIWSLTKAVEPAPALPLWKSTDRGAWRTEGEGGSEKEDAMEEGSSKDGNEVMSNGNSNSHQEEGFPSSFADIYPDFTLSLLHEEEVESWIDTKDNQASKQVDHHVFLATDVIGTGDLTICVVMPSDDNSIDEHAILRRFSMTIGNQRGKAPVHIESLSTLDDIPCSSAQQIQAIPIPLAPFSSHKSDSRRSSRFHSEHLNTMANDVLIVHKSKLSLTRSAEIYIGELVLPSDAVAENMQLVEVKSAVGDRADLLFTDENDEQVIVRSSISFVMHTSPITEMSLRAIESALITSTDMNDTSFSGAVLSLMIRADCLALSQFIEMDGASLKVEDHCWYSLSFVLLNLFLGSNITNEMQGGTASPKSAWEELLQSDFHASFTQGEGKLLFADSALSSLTPQKGNKLSCQYIDIISSAKMLNKSQISGYMTPIFDSLHVLHEDCRLASQSRGSTWTRRLGSLLLHVCEQNRHFMVDYEDHYRRLLGDTRCKSNACDEMPRNTYKATRVSSYGLPPCIMTCLDSTIQLGTEGFTLEDTHFGMAGYMEMENSGLNGTCSTSWTVVRLFKTLFGNSNADDRVVITMIEEGITKPSQLQDELPMSVSYPLLEAIHRCRLNPPQMNHLSEYIDEDKVRSFYELIGRNDLAALSVKGNNSAVHDHINLVVNTNAEDPDKDGLVALEDYSSMIFPEDNRIHEAVRLLRSSRTLFLRVPRPVELSDHDFERTKQEKLLLLCRRSIALPLGRGMITLGSHNIQSSEQLFIPNIVLAGRVPPTNNTLALGKSFLPLDNAVAFIYFHVNI
jgi:hypothetical protein